MSASDLSVTGNTPVAAPAITSTNSAAASKDMFLKLLVAQLSHQDPLTPSDGTQFVTQLAQFTTLEQSTQMGQDLAAIRAALTANAAPPSTEKTSS
ncbi:MAG: flagellar hook capping FlgD N-terminal domain-containing protein [Acidobacteriota bacterium]